MTTQVFYMLIMVPLCNYSVRVTGASYAIAEIPQQHMPVLLHENDIWVVYH